MTNDTAPVRAPRPRAAARPAAKKAAPAAAKKAPAKKATAAKKAAPASTAAKTAKTVATGDFISWQGRRMAVERPTAEQLGVYKRTAARLTQLQGSAKPDAAKSEELAGLFGRIIGVCTSLLVDQDDKDYVEDLLLEKKVQFDDAGEIVTKAVDHFAGKQQKTTAPTAGPVARRRR